MSECKDAYCRKCRNFTEVIWSQVEIATVHQNGAMHTFKGLEMRCSLCDYEITKVGWVGPTVDLTK